MTFQLNREQEQAASTLDRDVVVTAGAGSGKTRMLTQRFINAVVPGRVAGWEPVSVDDVVAITFTDKAAGELAERVRLTLRDAGFAGEARRVDGAWVSTIHGLCSRLLRRHAFEADVDPLFEVADTVVAGRIRAEALERAATRLVAADAEVAGLIDTYGYGRACSAAAAVARELSIRGLTPDDIEVEPGLPAAVVLGHAVDVFSDGQTACDDYDGTAKSPGEYVQRCAHLLGRVLDLRETELDERNMLMELAALVGEYKPLRSVTGLQEVAEDSKQRGIALKGEVGAALVAPHARGLRTLAAAFATEFEALKRQAGVLDFDDLQVKAVGLLAQEPLLAERYREQFKLVMIDEFQDTDELQLRLVESLSRGDLCTVGDEKQSIYRFRGADIGVYRKHREQMSERDALQVSLGVNYRSHPEILAFVNAVFSAEEYFKGDLLRLSAPKGGRPAQPVDGALGEGPRVEALFVDTHATDGPTGRRAEAREIARRLAALKRTGVDPSEMVILVRAYSNAHVYAEALSGEGVPAIIVGGSRFFGLEEIAIMRALNRAIANPADGSAIGELLASEFCSVSDNGLARLRLTAQGSDRRPLWSALGDTGISLPGDDGEMVRRLVELIEDARRDVGARPLSEVLLHAVEAAGYDLRLLSRGNAGRDAFANVLKLARQAEAFEASGGTGPAGFAAYLDAKEQLGDVEAPASVSDDGSSAVRIMSVHASKGLEFPVVVVPDLASTGRGNSALVRTSAEPGRLRVSLAPPTLDDGTRLTESTWSSQMSEAEREADAEEGDRVLYVAFTRARDLLIASGSMNMRPKSASQASHHLIRLARILGVKTPATGTSDVPATVADHATGETALCRVRIIDAADVLTESSDAAVGLPDTPAGTTPVAGPRFEDVSAAVASPERVSYSSLHLFGQCPRRFLIQDTLRLSPIEIGDPGSPDPMRFGSAMHAVLQLMKNDASLPSDERMAALGRQHELDEEQLARLHGAAQRFAASSTAARAIAHERVAREMPFALPIAFGACHLAGNIDLYARTGNDALVVDYKSGVSGTEEGLRDRYALQADCYALAALVDGCTSVEVVFVRPEVPGLLGEPQEIGFRYSGEDEQRLRADIERRYEQICRSEFEPLEARDEAVCGYCAAPPGLCPNARQ